MLTRCKPTMTAIVLGLTALFLSGGCSEIAKLGQMGLNEQTPVDVTWKQLQENDTMMRWLVAGTGDPFGQLMLEQNQAAMKAASGSLTMEAFDALTKDVANSIADELPNLPSVKNSPYKKMLLVVGDMQNRIANSDPDLTRALRALERDLRNHPRLQDRFVFLHGTQEEAKKMLSALTDPEKFKELVGDAANVKDYHPDAIFHLKGELYQKNEEDTHRMFISIFMEGWKPRNNTVEYDREFRKEYRYHPIRKAWVTKEEDERLVAAYQAAQETKK